MPFNNNPFMSKALRKAIMHRSKLKNIINTELKTTGQITKVNLLRKTKTEYFQKLNVKDLSDNRKIWKTIKPFFTNKSLSSNKLMLKKKTDLLQRKKS